MLLCCRLACDAHGVGKWVALQVN